MSVQRFKIQEENTQEDSPKKKGQTTVMTSLQIKKMIRDRMNSDGYSRWKKGLWINESIRAFLQLDDIMTFIEAGIDPQDSWGEREVFTLDTDTERELMKVVDTLEIRHGKIRGLRSTIIREAMKQRSIRPSGWAQESLI